MPITQLYDSTGTTISTNEYSLPSKTTSTGRSPITTDGVYQLFVDLGNLLTSDEYVLKIYEVATTGTAQQLAYQAALLGKQNPPMLVTPSLVLLHGWDMTLAKIAGGDRIIPYSIRPVA